MYDCKLCTWTTFEVNITLVLFLDSSNSRLLRNRSGRSHAMLPAPTQGLGALRDSDPSGCEEDYSKSERHASLCTSLVARTT